VTQFLARHERFQRVGSTNDVVRDWLAGGTAEVCLAVADEQTAGRGRSGRTWQAPAGAALLLSLGFRPAWLAPDRAWQLAATASLAMAGAASSIAGLAEDAIGLKWPNDLVVETETLGLRKLGGLLGETQGLGTTDPRVVVGIGLNAGWLPDEFPAELAGSMTSLHQLSDGRPIDQVGLLDAFLVRLEAGIQALRGGRFDAGAWSDHQLTNGRTIRLERPDGTEVVHALGVDGETGGLVVADPAAPNGERLVLVGEVSHVRLAPIVAVGV